MLVIAVCGRAGSGKTTVAKLFAKKLGSTFIEVSEVVRSHALANERIEDTLGESHESRKILQDEIKHQTDPNWLYNSITSVFPKGKDTDEATIIISGLRDPYVAYKLMNDFQFMLIRVDVSALVRYGRLATRDGYISIEEMRTVDVRDSDLGLDLIMTYPYALPINGDKTIEVISERVDKYCYDIVEARK